MSQTALSPPPGPKGHWLSGNLNEYRLGRLEFYEKLYREYGPMAHFRLGSIRLLLVCEPDVLKEVFVTRNKEFGRSFSTRMLQDFFGDGLLVSEGKQWLKDRRLIQPTFAADKIRGFAEPMVRQTDEFLQTWKPGERRDALTDMQSLTMSIAAETLLGVKLKDEVAAIHAPHELIRNAFDRRLESLLALPKWIPTAHNRRVESAHLCIRQIVDEVIARRKATGELGTDILSRLIHVQKQEPDAMSDEHIRDQVLTFLFAGHETTAGLLGWTWILLSRHPEVEAKLLAELQAVIGNRLPTVEDIPNLPYTEKIVRETLRLYPSAYVMGRRVLHDMELGGYQVKKETNLVISPWVMQRDERFYEDPLEFQPERWTESFQRQLNQFAWFPFGAGPRVCIGNTFATTEAILLVATIAARYKLDLQPGQTIVPKPSVTIRPSPGIKVTVTPRS